MKTLVDLFRGRLETIRGWRHHLHKHPELSLEETATARYIAGLLRTWGYDVTEGVGGHGIVASLTAGTGTRAIGLRADFDAQPGAVGVVGESRAESTRQERLPGHVVRPRFGKRAGEREQDRSSCQRYHGGTLAHVMTKAVHDEVS